MSQSIAFKIATANLQSLPQLPSITKGLNSVAGCHLIGFQECDLRDYKRATLARYPQAIGIGTPKRLKNNTYSCPVVHNRATFAPIWKRARKLYDGEGGVSLTRHLIEVGYRHQKTGMAVGFVNLHSVVTHGNQRAKRAAMKREAKAVTFDTVREILEAGFPVAVVGDFNGTGNWFGKTFAGHRVQRVTHGIDQVVLIDGDHHHWTAGHHTVVKTPSDHDTLRVAVTLTSR